MLTATLFTVVASVTSAYAAFDTFNTTQKLNYFNLPSESHEILTDDGYLLTAFRIPRANATPILFVHGFLASSDVWLLLPHKEQNIATILYEAGYDIWLLNVRGNEYSRKHVSMSPISSNEKYWNFSFHEIGVSDLPATIDYILNQTGEQSLIYVGHSMGTTSLMVTCSELPEYNSKIKVGVFLAPVVYSLSKPKVPIISFGIQHADFIANYLYKLKIYEFLGQNSLKNKMIELSCLLHPSTCARLFRFIYKQNLNNMIIESLPYYLMKISAGTSVKLFQHIAKTVHGDASFKMFDYGPEKNRAVYGTSYPKTYDIEKVTAPLALFHSKLDAFTDDESLSKLRSKVRNVMFDYTVPDPLFQHMDYLYGLNSKELVAKPLLKLLRKFCF